jgi:hypothetical protein
MLKYYKTMASCVVSYGSEVSVILQIMERGDLNNVSHETGRIFRNKNMNI